MFGEYVMARRYPKMVKEVFLKMSMYNIIVDMKVIE